MSSGGLQGAVASPVARLFAESRSIDSRSYILEIATFSNQSVSLQLTGI